jgi:redox-sensitive bicupin YhaK (pirin superfamily)
MEIISYVLSGELEHRDSIGNGSAIRPGDVQRMSAGSGIRHSEFNPSATEGLHFLQIWIKPNVLGIEPSYEEKRFSDPEKQGRLLLIASPDGARGSVRIHQDAFVYAGRFDGDESAKLELAPARRGYVHVVRGSVNVNGVQLAGGDALEITDSPAIAIDAGRASEVLVFDLP